MFESSARAGVVSEEELPEELQPQEAPAQPAGGAAPWSRWELWAYLLILLVALGLRLWDLGAKALHHDESLHALYAWYIFDGRGYRHDPMMHGPFQFFGYDGVFQLLWDSDFTVRLLPALFGTVLVGLPILLRRYLGSIGALATSVMLALSPTMLYFSRFIRNDIYMAVWAVLLVAFLWRYQETRKARYLVGTSLVLALAFATKETVYILVAVLGSYLFINAASDVVPWVLGRKRLRDFSPQGDLLVLMGSLSLPLGVAGVALFQGSLGVTLANPDWATGPVGVPKGTGLYVAFFAVAGALAAATAVGMRWRPWTWLVCFGAFATVWVLLYSSFFTNFSGGLLSGLWRSLGYWAVQQDVARGGQPWYYYLVVGLNYEFLPILVGSAAAVYYLLRGDRFSRFLAYWAVGTLILHTYASEKMPWLLVGVSLPFFFLAGKFLGALLERRPWQRSSGAAVDTAPVPWLRTVHWPAVAFTLMLALLLAVGGRWLSLALAKESGLSVRLVGLLAVLVPALAAACVYLLWQMGNVALEVRKVQGTSVPSGGLNRGGSVNPLGTPPGGSPEGGQSPPSDHLGVSPRFETPPLRVGEGDTGGEVTDFWGKAQVGPRDRRKRLALVVVSLAGLMLGVSTHASFRAAYANADVPVEMLVYTQSAPDIPRIMADIERLGRETGKGRELKITVDATYGFSWPWAWYLRNYKFVGYPCYSNEPGCQRMDRAPDSDVVLLAADNYSSAGGFLGTYGPAVPYKHRWWFPESYRGISRETLGKAVRKKESWCKVVNYFLYREFGQPIGSVDSYAFFPKEFTPSPVGREAQKATRC